MASSLSSITTASFFISVAQHQQSDTASWTDNGYDNGYFVPKGSCRRCGKHAYFKQQCKRCLRKYCEDCAPSALQMYHSDRNLAVDDHQEEEEEMDEPQWCCIGCEPHMVIAEEGQEPILELEPESEVIPMFDDMLWSSAVHPIHVPISATTATPCMEHKDENNEDDYDDFNNEQANHCEPSTNDETLETSEYNRNHECKQESSVDQWDEPIIKQPPIIVDKPTPKNSSSPSSERTIGTSISTATLASSENTGFLDEHDGEVQQRQNLLEEDMEQMWVSRRGCCSACQQFATGKQPCNGCGRKFCNKQVCLSYLSQVDCALCCPTPAAPLPEPGCCAECHDYATNKSPCQGCGLKYCFQCDADNLLDNGTCTKCCRSKMVQSSVPPPTVDFEQRRSEKGCCNHCKNYAAGKQPCGGCGMKYCQQADCSAQMYAHRARCASQQHDAIEKNKEVKKTNGVEPLPANEASVSIFSFLF